MSAPMTATQAKVQLAKWGIVAGEFRDWATHNRGDRGNGWYNVNGFMVHHTGSDSTDQKPFLYDGDAELPGPLCQFHIDSVGKVWFIGWGRANHAGTGDPAVMQHVINEDYTGILHSNYHQGSTGGIDGNGRFYGVEIGYSGSHGMSAAQYSSLLKLAAAVCSFHGWSAKSVIAHGEWSNWKWDPGYASGKMMDMNAVRNDVQDTLSGKGNGDPESPSPDSPNPRTIEVKTGDTIVFPGGGKAEVK